MMLGPNILSQLKEFTMLKYMTLCMLFCSSMGLAFAGKEIEIKISIEDGLYPVLLSWLSDNAQYKGESVQKEYYLRKPDSAWDTSAGFNDSLETMRVRLEPKGDSFCFKYRHLDPITKKTTHRDEEETKVESGAVMIKILEKLGYTSHTVVHKIRKTYMVDAIYEIVLDEVQYLGNFVEIELKQEVADVATGNAQILELLKTIGITKFIQYDRGYIHMLWNPGYQFGEEHNLAKKKCTQEIL